MEDRFVKDFDLSFDNQLLVDYEIEIPNEINSLFDDIKKENYFFYSLSAGVFFSRLTFSTFVFRSLTLSTISMKLEYISIRR